VHLNESVSGNVLRDDKGCIHCCLEVGDWLCVATVLPSTVVAAYSDGPPIARPHVGRAIHTGPSVRGLITPFGLAAGGAVL